MSIKRLLGAVVTGAMIFAYGGQVIAAQVDPSKNEYDKYATAISTNEIVDVSLSADNDNLDAYKITAPSTGDYMVKILGYDAGKDDCPVVTVCFNNRGEAVFLGDNFNYTEDYGSTVDFYMDKGKEYLFLACTYNSYTASDFSFFIFKKPSANSWVKAENKWFYYSAAKNDFLTGWQKIGGQWYLFDNDGMMLTGWQKSSGKWYYLASSGAMLTGWQRIGGTWYFLKSGGDMASNEYCGGYWLNADGSWTYQHKAKWTKDKTGWWYGDTSGWYAKSASYVIDGKSYNFNASGYCTNP